MTNSELERVRKQINELREREKKLLAQEEYENSLPPVYRLAMELFRITGRGDESWHYEVRDGKPDWNGSCHDRFLKMAGRIMAFKANNHGLNISDAAVVKLFQAVTFN